MTRITDGLHSPRIIEQGPPEFMMHSAPQFVRARRFILAPLMNGNTFCRHVDGFVSSGAGRNVKR
jgi:hypothetical protein